MTDSRETENQETGNVMLAAGGGFAAYGTTMALTASYVCPVCVVATPLLLGYGGYQKYKYLQSKKATETDSKAPEA